MEQNGKKLNKFTELVTDERLLFSYRAITVLGAAYFAFVGTKILNTNEELKQTMNDLKLTNAIDIATLKGQVSVIDKRVDIHAQRLDNNDKDRQVIWSRVYELVSKMNKQ